MFGKAIPKDHPERRRFAILEGEAERKVLAALQTQRRDLFRGITRANVWEIMRRLQSPEVTENLRVAFEGAMLPSAMQGGDVGREQVDKEVFGVS